MVQDYRAHDRRHADHEGDDQRGILAQVSHEKDGESGAGSRYARQNGEALSKSQDDHVRGFHVLDRPQPGSFEPQKQPRENKQRPYEQSGLRASGEAFLEEEVERYSGYARAERSDDKDSGHFGVKVQQSTQELIPEPNQDCSHGAQMKQNGVG